MRCCSGIVCCCCCFYPPWRRVIRTFYHDDRNTSFCFFKNKSSARWLVGWERGRESLSRVVVAFGLWLTLCSGVGRREGWRGGGGRDYPS